jgi:Uma2 family endonuclease
MCYERWRRREQRREERFEEEVRFLTGQEGPRREPRAPVLERERDEEPRDPERVRVEAGMRA